MGALFSSHISVEPANQLSCYPAILKATIDIPDDLYREVKLRALHRGTTIRQVVLDALQASPYGEPTPEREIVMEKGVPVIRLGLEGKIPALTNQQIADLLD
jgi:hypothetical protein